MYRVIKTVNKNIYNFFKLHQIQIVPLVSVSIQGFWLSPSSIHSSSNIPFLIFVFSILSIIVTPNNFFISYCVTFTLLTLCQSSCFCSVCKAKQDAFIKQLSFWTYRSIRLVRVVQPAKGCPCEVYPSMYHIFMIILT